MDSSKNRQMASIKIPNVALPGFNAILELDDSQVNELLEYFKAMPVGTKPQQIYDALSNIFESSKAKNILSTLMGLSELLDSPQVDIAYLAESLARAFKEQFNDDEITKQNEEILSNRLKLILGESTNLRLTLKAVALISGDNHLYTESKVVTDIRLVFNEDIESNNRNALIVHHLNIDYYGNNHSHKASFLLDSNDLRKLKAVIERAIRKEELIRKDYESSFNFLNLSSDV